MIIKVKLIFLLSTVIVILAILSAAVSFILLRNILSPKSPGQSAAPRNTATPSTPYPTRAFGIPLPGANTATVNTFWNKIRKQAVQTQTVTITDCKPEPQIAGLTLQKPFILKNSDTTPVTIRVSDKVTYIIPAQSTVDATADFGHGYGVYDLSCNGSTSVGVFVVENP